MFAFGVVGMIQCRIDEMFDSGVDGRIDEVLAMLDLYFSRKVCPDYVPRLGRHRDERHLRLTICETEYSVRAVECLAQTFNVVGISSDYFDAFGSKGCRM